MEKQWTVTDFIFLCFSITEDGDCSHEIKLCLLLGRKTMIKVHLVKVSFSSSHVWMWELDYKGGWVLRNWCFWTVVLEKTLESLLDWKIKWVNPKGNQACIFIGGTYAEAEAPIHWPPDEKSQLTGKDSDAVTDWRQEEKGVTENEVVGWHHWFNGLKFGQTLGDGERHGSLAWGCPLGLQRVRHDWVTKGLQSLFFCIKHCPRLWELPLALKGI